MTKIEGRIKNRTECIKKFERKYQSKLEASEQPYTIKEHLTDLIGIRIVCLYEDQISLVANVMREYFHVIEETDKISAIESTEDLFGYKGLHMDLEPNIEKSFFNPFRALIQNPVELQIRSLIQDAWSVLDHKIKYKKSIPSDLKRRINVLSALFELADREFKEIRDATVKLLEQETNAPICDEPGENTPCAGNSPPEKGGKTINAFNFLRIAGHFFKDFSFEDYKVDNFVQDILKLDRGFEKSNLHESLVDHLKDIRAYREEFMAENTDATFSPYTTIRHCLYLHDRQKFGRILSTGPRIRFNHWLDKQNRHAEITS